ncbi:hypothetical protein NMG60_11021879 [Bertholletia excelsa]
MSLFLLDKMQKASLRMVGLKKMQNEKSMRRRSKEMGIERADSHLLLDHYYETESERERLSDAGTSRESLEELRRAIRDGLARQNLQRAETKANCVQKFASDDNLPSPNKAEEKPKGSNLIAKLMGLDEFPSQAMLTAERKQLEIVKVSSQRRLVHDADMPNPRKLHSSAYKANMQRKALKRITETMKLKVLLKSNSPERFSIQSQHSDASYSIRMCHEDDPPIVIIKPWRLSSVVEAEGPNSKMNKPQTRIKGPSGGAINSDRRDGRPKGMEAPIKRVMLKGAENSKEDPTKPEERVKTDGKLLSKKVKVSAPVNEQQKEKAIKKIVDSTQTLPPYKRKTADMENKSKVAVSKSRIQPKATSTKERKPEIRSNTMKTRVSLDKASSPIPILKHTRETSHGNCGRKEIVAGKKNLKNEKPVKEPEAVENVGRESDNKLNKSIDAPSEDESDKAATGIADQLLTKERIVQCVDNNEILPCNVVQLNTQHGSCIEWAEETKYCIRQHEARDKCFRTETPTKDMLLGSPSFLSYAENLFDINPDKGMVSQATTLEDYGKTETSLLLDCAYELVQQKNLELRQIQHPLLNNPRNSKIRISLALLVEKVCDGIEKLPANFIYSALERDLKCQGMAGGVWDLGWRYAFTVDEVGQVVGDVEKLVLSGIIEEMIREFML